jgi:PAS domain S-box-containing protein
MKKEKISEVKSTDTSKNLKKAEKKPHDDRFRALADHSLDIVIILDPKGIITYINPSVERILGYKIEDRIGTSGLEPIYPDDLKSAIDKLKILATDINSPAFYGETRLRHKDGSWRIFETVGSNLVHDDVVETIIVNLRDITERKKAKEKLRESEANYKQLFDNSPAAIYQVDYKSGKLLKANDAFCKYIGCSQEEIKSLSPYDILTEESKKLFWERVEKISQGIKVPEIVEFEALDRKGKPWCFQLHIKNIYDAEGNVIAADVVAHDITELKITEKALRESEIKYRTFFENAIEGIYQVTIDGRFVTVNKALARMAGYDSPEEFIESIKDVKTHLYAHSEDRDRFLEIIKTNGFVEGFETEFYRKNRSTFWVVINALAVKDEQGRIIYNEGLIEDITLRKKAEEQLQRSIEILKKEINTTIHVLSTALETRDPYTAGHQSRVADLARAIATEMRLDRDKIDGIRMAGVIHDIGKLSIPVEILSKPSKLTKLEFSLIKEHSHSGFEMLKDVESVWPLAQIVYQHHERINGAGYPRNLRGDEILIEARILAVADVVEAMASHRPYRASLGIDTALEEIEKNKGILYDETVADACLRLFRENGYKLTQYVKIPSCKNT